jgi:hypothetical protein
MELVTPLKTKARGLIPNDNIPIVLAPDGTELPALKLPPFTSSLSSSSSSAVGSTSARIMHPSKPAPWAHQQLQVEGVPSPVLAPVSAEGSGPSGPPAAGATAPEWPTLPAPAHVHVPSAPPRAPAPAPAPVVLPAIPVPVSAAAKTAVAMRACIALLLRQPDHAIHISKVSPPSLHSLVCPFVCSDWIGS